MDNTGIGYEKSAMELYNLHMVLVFCMENAVNARFCGVLQYIMCLFIAILCMADRGYASVRVFPSKGGIGTGAYCIVRMSWILVGRRW